MRKCFTLALVLACAATLAAQSRPALTPADYGQWESASLPNGAWSPDGAWLAYTLSRVNENNELRLIQVGQRDLTIAFGSQPTFSSNSRWAAYRVGVSNAEEEKMREARVPVRNKLGLANLTTGETMTIDAVQAFRFSGDGRFIVMERYPPQAPAGGNGRGGGPAANADDDPAGETIIVRNLASATEMTFGNVSSHAWQDDEQGHLLAMTISADERHGNGVHLFDPDSGVLRVLDANEAIYTGLSWREDSSDLAVLRSFEDDTHAGTSQRILAWRNLADGAAQRRTLDPSQTPDFPADTRIVSTRVPSWSDNGSRVFVGVAAWQPASEPSANGATDAPEPADLDIWHWRDAVVMARQKTGASRDRQRNLLAVWHVDDDAFTQIGRSFDEQVTLVPDSDLALVEEWSAYAMPRSIGRPAADLYVADVTTGARTALKTGVNDRYVSVSPGGRYVLFLEGGHWWTQHLTSGAVTNLTRDVRTSFINTESDSTGPEKPPFGTAGWTSDDAAVILYDKYDLWRVAADGSGAARLTNGRDDRVRHRYVRVDRDAETIALDGLGYLSLFGELNKRSGYGRLRRGRVDRLVFDDQMISGLTKAPDADRFAYIAQTHADSPDIFVTNGSLGDPMQVSETNAFQNRYAWSRGEVVSYTGETGTALQGALYYPAGYQPGRRYPMIVYLYERLSDNVHRYVVPSAESYYNTTVFTSNGYFVFQPDIVFRPGEPGKSVVESVRPAVKAVVDRGLVDAARVGVIGHSWGGFDASYLAARTTTFAAAVAGAAITNLVSNYGNHHWSSGIAETDHIETGQQRMVVPLYEDLEGYIDNSAVFNAHNMTTPLLLETGDDDGTVFWHQAVEMYNIARRAGRNVVMLVYNGEDHGLRTDKNRTDYQRRILDWFGHYLQGEPAKAWITEGRSFLEREGGE